MRTICCLATLAGLSTLALAQNSFEVASIKPNKSGFGRKPDGPPITTAPASVTMRNVRLSTPLQWAYGLKEYQISGPDWLNSEGFDITAKAQDPAPDDQLKRMLQALLTDRFKLTTHRENKEMPVYTLTTGKNGSKLSAGHEGQERSMQPVEGTWVFKNYSMPLFVDFLGRLMDRPVLDATTLKGPFDFTLRVSEDPETPADMKRAFTQPGFLAPAIIRYLQDLGLKLEARTAPVEILVIDHAEKIPTEN
jgi:uncharacterized protein (TIGR03435 family)